MVLGRIELYLLKIFRKQILQGVGLGFLLKEFNMHHSFPFVRFPLEYHRHRLNSYRKICTPFLIVFSLLQHESVLKTNGTHTGK